jgi:predicted membrane chloride channel (bestrophin family)
MIGEELPSSSSPADAATEEIGRTARMTPNDGNMNEFEFEAMNKRLASFLIVALIHHHILSQR